MPPEGSAKVVAKLETGLEVVVRLADDQEPLPGDAVLYLLEEAAWDAFHIERANGGTNIEGGPTFPGFSSNDRALYLSAGRNRLRGLAPGRYRFKGFAEGGLQVEPEFLDLRDDVEVVLRWSR